MLGHETQCSAHKSRGAVFLLSPSGSFDPIYIAFSQTMRSSFVLAVVALTASISANASGDDSMRCPLFCRHDDQCKDCIDVKRCVSISSLRCPTSKHITHRRGRTSFSATFSVAVDRHISTVWSTIEVGQLRLWRHCGR
jgi:hypothetical protein